MCATPFYTQRAVKNELYIREGNIQKNIYSSSRNYIQTVTFSVSSLLSTPIRFTVIRHVCVKKMTKQKNPQRQRERVSNVLYMCDVVCVCVLFDKDIMWILPRGSLFKRGHTTGARGHTFSTCACAPNTVSNGGSTARQIGHSILTSNQDSRQGR